MNLYYYTLANPLNSEDFPQLVKIDNDTDLLLDTNGHIVYTDSDGQKYRVFSSKERAKQQRIDWLRRVAIGYKSQIAVLKDENKPLKSTL